MRLFMGAWAAVAIVASLFLLVTLSYRPWGLAAAVCGILLAGAAAFLHRVPVWAAATGMSLSVGATAAGLAVTRTHICCMFGVIERRGYPFGWLTRSADYLDLPGRVPPPPFADDARWRVEEPLLLADLMIWGMVGLVLMVGFSVVVRQAGRVGLLRIRRGSF